MRNQYQRPGSGPGAGVDPAVATARRVVGLYGDPGVSWSIVIALDLRAALDPGAVASRLAALGSQHRHLGPAARLERFSAPGEPGLLARFADSRYGDADPLLRVALSEYSRTLVLAAHHGAMDGLGLLGAAAAISGLDLSTTARGIERDAEPGGFLRRAAARLIGALLSPPARLAAGGGSAAAGDCLVAVPAPATHPGSAALLAAAVETAREWNRRSGSDLPQRRLVVAMGLSRRPGAPAPAPDRDTAYVRLPAGRVSDRESAAALIAATAPEPAIPETEAGGLAPLAGRLLRNRLGSTLLISNLGVISSPEVVAVRFWPVPTGPAGVALGLGTAADGVRLTVRARAAWFDSADAAGLAELAAAKFAQYGS